MDNDKRRNIIVREIGYWRKNKLLPEQYCDFLLNLYADETAAGQAQSQGLASAIIGSNPKRFFYILSALTVITILCLNFTVFPLPLQIGLVALLVFLGYAYGIIYRVRKPVLSHAVLGISSILLLIAGPLLLRMHSADEPIWIGSYIALCSLIWIIQGLVFRMGWFHFCGWIGIMLVYAWSVYISIDELHWIHLQLMWLPLAFIFLWIAWFLHRSGYSSATVFFAVATLQWFVPDVISLILYGTTGMVQVLFIVKMIAASLLLYRFRNLWTKWVL